MKDLADQIATISANTADTVALSGPADMPHLARLLHDLRECRRQLQDVEQSVERRIADMSGHRGAAPKSIDIWPGVIITVRGGAKRRNWPKEYRHSVISRVVEAFMVSDDGEIPPEADLVWQVIAELEQAANIDSFRVTHLRDRGIEYDDCCELVDSRRTVDVQLTDTQAVAS